MIQMSLSEFLIYDTDGLTYIIRHTIYNICNLHIIQEVRNKNYFLSPRQAVNKGFIASAKVLLNRPPFLDSSEFAESPKRTKKKSSLSLELRLLPRRI